MALKKVYFILVLAAQANTAPPQPPHLAHYNDLLMALSPLPVGPPITCPRLLPQLTAHPLTLSPLSHSTHSPQHFITPLTTLLLRPWALPPLHPEIPNKYTYLGIRYLHRDLDVIWELRGVSVCDMGHLH